VRVGIHSPASGDRRRQTAIRLDQLAGRAEAFCVGMFAKRLSRFELISSYDRRCKGTAIWETMAFAKRPGRLTRPG